MYYINVDGKEFYNVRFKFTKKRLIITNRNNEKIFEKQLIKIADLFIEFMETKKGA